MGKLLFPHPQNRQPRKPPNEWQLHQLPSWKIIQLEPSSWLGMRSRCGKTALPFSNTHLISYITKWLEREILKKKKFFWTFEVQGNPDLYFEKTCMLKGLEWGERTKHWNEDKRKRKMKKVQLSFQNYFILSPEQKLSRTQKQSALKTMAKKTLKKTFGHTEKATNINYDLLSTV